MSVWDARRGKGMTALWTEEPPGVAEILLLVCGRLARWARNGAAGLMY
jgi:hypothetical protein